MPERPPFDPARIRAPAGSPVPSSTPAAPFTVRQINELVRGALHLHLPPTVYVLGQIGNLSRPSSGHLYFTLKDQASELPCVMWRSDAAKLRFTLEVGMEVIATGGLDVYLPRGAYQLYVRKLEPRGVGALEVAFRQLREKLEREGLFDPRRKKALPRIPQRLALVTSPSGAAIRDILQTLRRRFPPLEILLFPVRVQGTGAAEEIAAAIRLMNEHRDALGGIDVAIVGRGGGSLEDLWAFNEEVVARAIVASRIPLISAVGHEVDVTISDLVADLRAPTPTAAAELVAPDARELREWLAQRTIRAARATRHAVELGRAHLRAVLASDVLARPLLRLRERAQRVDELCQRLRLALRERFRTARERMNRAQLALLRFRSGAYFRRRGERLAHQLRRLDQTLHRRCMERERALAERLARLERITPRRWMDRCDEHLSHVARRLVLAVAGRWERHRRHLQSRLDALAAYDPHRVLARGYSITRDARTRRVLRSIAEVRPDLRIVTELSDGRFHAVAEDPHQPPLFE